MNIDQDSFRLGVGAGAGLVGLLLLTLFILKQWIRALFSGAAVPFATIVGMRLRGNPPALLIDAYIQLRKIGVMVGIDFVEVVYIANKTKASTPDMLAKLVLEQQEKMKGS